MEKLVGPVHRYCAAIFGRERAKADATPAPQSPEMAAVDFDTSIGDDTPVQRRAHLYAVTEPSPLYDFRSD